MAVSRTLARTLAALLALNALTAVAQNGTTSCAQCEDVAHGFASLNGGTYGGKGGRIVTATTYQELKTYAGSSEPLIIRVQGTLAADPKGYEIPIKSNKTIIGVGQTGHIFGGGLGINNQSNIIIRNLRISDTYIPTDYNGKTEGKTQLQRIM